MKKLLLLLLIVAINSCAAQTAPNTIYNEDFKWRITIPKTFESVDAAEWAKLRSKGTEAIEKTVDGKIVDQSKGIFVFKSDQFNYFESNYQPFDIAVDGDHVQSSKAVCDLLYQTFKTQMPNAKVDTSFAKETIGGLVFDIFKVKVLFSANFEMHMMMYNHLFEKDKKEFTVNVIYVDPRKGNLILDAWRSSTFGE